MKGGTWHRVGEKARLQALVLQGQAKRIDRDAEMGESNRRDPRMGIHA